MTWKRNAWFLLLAGLTGACGEELPERETNNVSQNVDACALIEAVDLQQIFVNRLALDQGASTRTSCTWVDLDAEEPFLRYELHPATDNLQALVARLSDGDGRAAAEQVMGLGEAAVWTELGLFVTRSGRTLQITPLAEEGDRAPYQELARLLFTRLEAT